MLVNHAAPHYERVPIELGIDPDTAARLAHPQVPTGMRAVAELIQALRRDAGGVGLFTGCAAGDTGAALVLSVDG